MVEQDRPVCDSILSQTITPSALIVPIGNLGKSTVDLDPSGSERTEGLMPWSEGKISLKDYSTMRVEHGPGASWACSQVQAY
jgi:hypothetical protein